MSELLGEIVTWDMASREVDVAKVRTSLTAAGLDPAIVGDMAPKNAFARACRHLKENRAIDKLKADKDEISFQFTAKVAGERVEYDYECVVYLDPDSGTVTCPERPELAEQARDLVQFAIRTRNANDITHIVQKLFKSHSDLYAINPRGIAYFVPDKFKDFTAQVEKFITELGGRLLRFPVPKGTEEGNKSVRDSINAGLDEMIKELNEAMGEWDEGTRKDTVERANDRINLVRHKIDCYAEYLQSSQHRLRKQLRDTEAALRQKLESFSS